MNTKHQGRRIALGLFETTGLSAKALFARYSDWASRALHQLSTRTGTTAYAMVGLPPVQDRFDLDQFKARAGDERYWVFRDRAAAQREAINCAEFQLRGHQAYQAFFSNSLQPERDRAEVRREAAAFVAEQGLAIVLADGGEELDLGDGAFAYRLPE